MLPNGEIPLGLGMALAQNLSAMERFASMTEQEQSELIARTHNIKSKQEMQAFVNSLSGSDETRNALF